ncbi:MAG: lipid II:glycine glycyltransferase FemX [bacterium]
MSERLKIYRGGREKFNRLVMTSPHHSFLQSYEWGELKSEFGWKAHFLIGNDNRNAFLLLERDVPFIKRPMVYIPHAYIKSCDIELIEEYVRNNIGSFLIKWEPVEGVDSSVFERPDMKMGRRVQPKTTIVVDIADNIENVSRRFHQKTRYNIHLAMKRGVEVVIENTDDGFNKFYGLLKKTAKRKGFLVHSVNYHRRMYEIFTSSGMGTIFNAYYQGIISASIFVVRFGKKVYYCFGGSEPELARYMPSHLLHYRAMEWARERGCYAYDLWGIPENISEKHPSFGLYRFKAGFDGEIVKRLGAFDQIICRNDFIVFNVLLGLFNFTKNIITRGRVGDPMGG